MRFMMLLKADADTEAGVLPSREVLATMGKYNEALIAAGVLRDGQGLQPTSKGARVVFRESGTEVIDGPFGETKELIAGYWMIEVGSLAEAIEWAKKAPLKAMPGKGRDAQIELRQVYELSDFPDLPPEVEEMEKKFLGKEGVAPSPRS